MALAIRTEVGMFDPNVGAATRWKKGSSGNPGGRPKSRLLSEALRARLAEIKKDDPASRTFAEVVAENLVDIACSKGPAAVAAINETGDRLEGRPTQAVQISDLTREIREKSDVELQFEGELSSRTFAAQQFSDGSTLLLARI
jgi:hypothetical protein